MNRESQHQNIVFGRPLIDAYFKVWALVLPVTSVLVLPSIQGTTPAYLMAFLSIPLIIIAARIKDIKHYFFVFMVIAVAYITLNLISQYFLLFFEPMDLESLPLVNPLSYSGSYFLRPSMFTQSLYLLAGICTFLFIYHWYRPDWDPYIFGGILLLVAYGFYEVTYFWFTGTSGDFLTNRRFNGQHPGSLFQIINLAGVSMQRMKSLTGEPSMFAFTVLPYWIFAFHTKRYLIGGILTLALVLSTSTTAIIGMIIYVALVIYSNRIPIKYLLAAGIACSVLIALNFWTVLSVVNKLVIQKFSMESISGVTRFTNLYESVVFWLDTPLPTKVFGLGFGYIRSTDFFSTILVNNGLVGLLILIAAFSYPIMALGFSEKAFGLKCALIVIIVSMLMSVPEFAYSPMWLFLGISYNHLNRNYDVIAQHLYRRGG
jgi:hypothetical protein